MKEHTNEYIEVISDEFIGHTFACPKCRETITFNKEGANHACKGYWLNMSLEDCVSMHNTFAKIDHDYWFTKFKK